MIVGSFFLHFFHKLQIFQSQLEPGLAMLQNLVIGVRLFLLAVKTGLKCPHGPVVVHHHQHHSHIQFQSLVSIPVETAGLSNHFRAHSLTDREPRLVIGVLETSFIDRVGDVEGNVVISGRLEIQEDAFFFCLLLA